MNQMVNNNNSDNNNNNNNNNKTIVLVRVINLSPAPVTLYQNTSVGTFSQLENGALEPASCNCLATEKPRQTKPLVSEGFDLEAMSLSSPQNELASLLDEFANIFSSGPADLGLTGIMQHLIDTGDHPPIKQAPRRVLMHQQGRYANTSSPWATPIVLVKKKDGTTRFWVDYRKLNDMTRKDAYPLPCIDETLDALAGAKVFTTLDLASGYWQARVEVADRENTAFTTRHGLFEFQVMPFGLCNVPGTFQRFTEFVLAGLQWQTCLVYMDDVIVYGQDFDEHLERLREVLGPGDCKYQELIFKTEKMDFSLFYQEKRFGELFSKIRLGREFLILRNPTNSSNAVFGLRPQ